MITYTNIVKIRFIVPAISVEDGLKQEEITFQIGVNLKKWTLKYLTMNRISDIIISEEGDRIYIRGNLKSLLQKIKK